MNSMNNNDMMNKPMNQPGNQGQYPLSPPQTNSPHLRHPDQGMNNHIPSSSSSSQSQPISNHNSANGTQASQMPHPQPQAPPTSQPSTVGDDLNFDPTAIIDEDGSGPSLDVSLMFVNKEMVVCSYSW